MRQAADACRHRKRPDVWPAASTQHHTGEDDFGEGSVTGPAGFNVDVAAEDRDPNDPSVTWETGFRCEACRAIQAEIQALPAPSLDRRLGQSGLERWTAWGRLSRSLPLLNVPVAGNVGFDAQPCDQYARVEIRLRVHRRTLA